MRWITEAKYLDNYKIELTFNDGQTFPVDLKDSLTGPVFESLKDLVEFQKFRLNPELDTIVWNNGADFAPDYLYALGDKQNSKAEHWN